MRRPRQDSNQEEQQREASHHHHHHQQQQQQQLHQQQLQLQQLQQQRQLPPLSTITPQAGGPHDSPSQHSPTSTRLAISPTRPPSSNGRMTSRAPPPAPLWSPSSSTQAPTHFGPVRRGSVGRTIATFSRAQQDPQFRSAQEGWQAPSQPSAEQPPVAYFHPEADVTSSESPAQWSKRARARPSTSPVENRPEHSRHPSLSLDFVSRPPAPQGVPRLPPIQAASVRSRARSSTVQAYPSPAHHPYARPSTASQRSPPATAHPQALERGAFFAASSPRVARGFAPTYAPQPGSAGRIPPDSAISVSSSWSMRSDSTDSNYSIVSPMDRHPSSSAGRPDVMYSGLAVPARAGPSSGKRLEREEAKHEAGRRQMASAFDFSEPLQQHVQFAWAPQYGAQLSGPSHGLAGRPRSGSVGYLGGASSSAAGVFSGMVGAASLSAGQTSSNRRMAHLLSEQKRRESINSGFEDLRQAVPSCRDGQESKASLLRKAVQYIRELEARCATQTVKREEDINWTGPGGRHTPSDTRQRTESDSDEPLSGSRPRQRPAGQASESSRSAVKEEEMEEDDEEERRGDSSAMVDDDQVHQDSRMQLSMQMQIDSAKMRSPPPTATFPSLDHHSRQGAFARSPISSGAGQRHEFGFPRRSRVCPVPFCDEADDEAEVEVEAEARSYGSRFHQAQAASGWSRRAKPASSPGTLISPPDSGIKANFDHPMPSPAFSAPPPSPFFPIPNGGNNNHSHGHSHAQESDGNGNGNGNGDGNGDAHMQLSISTLTAPSLTHAPAALSARSTSSRAPSGTPRMGLESERSASIGPTAGNLRPSLVVGTPEMPKMLEAVPARP